MQVDPRAEKHYGMTPYNGMGNNPILYSDPMGDTIRIYGVDGQFVQYTPGMEYSGDNETIASTVNRLNAINATDAGGEVISELNSATGSYYTSVVSSDQLPNGAGAQFQPLGESGGDNSSGIVYLSSSGDPSNDLSHELFHAYQYETGETSF